MPILFEDNFDRADNTNIGDTWIETFEDAQILTNQLRFGNPFPAIVRTTPAAHGPLKKMKVTVKKVNNAHTAGPMARFTQYIPSHTSYLLATGLGATNTHSLQKVVSDVFTELWNRTATMNSGDEAALEVDGSTLRGFINTTQIGADFTDSSITGYGQSGIYADGTVNIDVDNFKVEGDRPQSLNPLWMS